MLDLAVQKVIAITNSFFKNKLFFYIKKLVNKILLHSKLKKISQYTKFNYNLLYLLIYYKKELFYYNNKIYLYSSSIFLSNFTKSF